MNKWQLVVLWVMGASIIISILCAPKMYYQSSLHPLGRGRWLDYEPEERCTMSRTRWDSVLQNSLIILIIGGLLIYTLRKPFNVNKRKVVKTLVYTGICVGVFCLLLIVAVLFIEPRIRRYEKPKLDWKSLEKDYYEEDVSKNRGEK